VPAGGGVPPGPKPDTTPPHLSHLHLAGRRLKVHVSEPATVKAKLARCHKGRCRTVRTLHAHAAKAGGVSMTIPRKIKPGRYRVSVRATDAAGNRSHVLVKTIRVRRRR
jgi:hypothetical protein